ncbi:hypothetical protein PTTG_28103 [Puccinia triticina 1-1 BBBD Race 1]|uniref:Uncharacterized protein n=1 Tax=Puccinia triticina (isolate 1-1 / race 1 (BBBD)) TaxID=630390 RepID=A0A180GEC5_PUCT1|nr:hypothetical protein PTTG_28103 [Puccinia triticina 1-1 BBBD Race 1]
MSDSLAKNSLPRASGDKNPDLPTLAGGTVNSATTATPQPLAPSEDLPLTSLGEASQVEAQSIEESLIPQDVPAAEPVTGPAKNTRAKANPAAKQKKTTKKQPDQSKKQSAPKAPRLPAEDQVEDPDQDIMELLGDRDCQVAAVPPPTVEAPPAERSHAAGDNREAIWLKAVEADNNGDTERSNFFYNMFASIVNNSKTPIQPAAINGTSIRPSLLSNLLATDSPPALAPPPSTSNLVSTDQPSEVKLKQKGLSFKMGCSNHHVSVGFTPFFDKNLKELKAPIPLTIFNQKWQTDAMSYHAVNRSRSDDNSSNKGLRYFGFPYPSEWLLSLGAWTVAHREFHVCIQDVYGFKVFADWLLAHKANCNKIHSNVCFLAALRYDIQMRANTFAHHITVGEETFVPDISVFRQDVADQCYEDARKKNKLEFEDNPYRAGGERGGWDPATGAPKGRPDFTQASSVQGSSRNGQSRSRGGRSRGYFGGD